MTSATPTTQPAAGSRRRRARLLLGAVLGSVLSSYLLAVLVAGAAGLTAGIGPNPAGLLTAAIPLWLAAHQIPLTVVGAPLGVLPLLPTVGLVVLTARFAARAAGKLGGGRGGDAAWAMAALAGGHACLAVLSTALPVSPAQVEPWHAMLGGALVAAAGAGWGVLRVAGAPAWWAGAPGWLRAGLTAAATGAIALAAAATLVLLAGLLADLGTVIDRFAVLPGPGGWLGIGVFTVCYLPNAVVAVVSWLAGPGVVIGTAAASPLSVAVGPLPPLPLLAAMPTGPPPGWAVIVFGCPVAVGVLVGLRCRRGPADLVSRLRSVGVAALVVALGFWVLASVVSGRLASGPFDPVELPALGGALALLGWVGLPAMVTVMVPDGTNRLGRLGRLGSRLAQRHGATPPNGPTGSDEPDWRDGWAEPSDADGDGPGPSDPDETGGHPHESAGRADETEGWPDAR